MIKAHNLQIDESALTGESVAVEKDIALLKAETPLAERKNMAYAGGFVTFGQGIGIVVGTGNQTETGKISQAIGFGIIGAIILQIIFAHVPLINQIFYTAPLTFNQWLICLAVGSPMIFWAALVNRFDPPN